MYESLINPLAQDCGLEEFLYVMRVVLRRGQHPMVIVKLLFENQIYLTKSSHHYLAQGLTLCQWLSTIAIIFAPSVLLPAMACVNFPVTGV